MIGAFFKALWCLRPFLREVFIHSSEDRRRWLGRMFIIFSIALIIGYLVVDYIVDGYHSLVAENNQLHQIVEQYRLELATHKSAHGNLLETTKSNGEIYRMTLEQHDLDVLTINRLENELAMCREGLPEAQHTVEPKKEPPDRLRGLDP